MNKYISVLILIVTILCCFSSCESIDDNTNQSNGKILMNNDDTYYEDGNWTLKSTVDHFKKLGFKNIKTISDTDYFLNEIVFNVEIDTGLLDEDGFESGDSFDASDTVKIYYYSTDFLLTIENCSDLYTALSSKDIEYMAFADEYDGEFVKFDAYVAYHTTYAGETSHIIDVCGGDYDGTTELGHADNDYYKGLVVRIGDKTWNPNIDKSVEEGQHVTVVGKIDAEQSEYYKCLYVECYYLGKR